MSSARSRQEFVLEGVKIEKVMTESRRERNSLLDKLQIQQGDWETLSQHVAILLVKDVREKQSAFWEDQWKVDKSIYKYGTETHQTR